MIFKGIAISFELIKALLVQKLDTGKNLFILVAELPQVEGSRLDVRKLLELSDFVHELYINLPPFSQLFLHFNDHVQQFFLFRKDFFFTISHHVLNVFKWEQQ